MLLFLLASSLTGFTASAQRMTAHFEIFHEAGFSNATEAYARLVEASLESAYDFFMTEGFAIFPEHIRVDILGTYPNELGAEYLEMDDTGDWIPIIEIATEEIMNDYLAYSYVDTSLEDLVASTCAHELFHAIQDYYSIHGMGDVSEQAFVEPQATAIQEAVVPEANDYLEPALDFLLAPDSMAFFQRSYDAGIFWVYVMDRFDLRMILDVMKASTLYDGRYAIDHAFAAVELSFFDVWTDFAVSLATGALPDADVFSLLVPVAESSGWWTKDREPAVVPPPTVRETWRGVPVDLDRVNATNESEYVPQYEDDAIGTPLRVAHAYGIDILEIVIASTTPLTITFEGDSSTQFRTIALSETKDVWSQTLFAQSLTLYPDESTTRIRIVITRSEAGTGKYSIALRPGI
ncbi:hypothetical protein KKG90_08730 [Candidatus Bipolaricaulota bacterium]|nr:hypothetical protein [Candidatus Bipolaricaulota bacterium]